MTSQLKPEQKLSLAMLLLTVQDLKLEKIFEDSGSMSLIRNHLVITKSSKLKKYNMTEALTFVFNKEQDYTYSFDNCCGYLYIEPSFLRKKLLAYLQNPGYIGYKYYMKWKESKV